MATSSFSVEVTGELANRVSNAVASGEYATNADVVRAALERWSEEREPEDIAHLKKCWDEAMLDSGISVEPEQVFRELRAKYGFPNMDADSQ